MPLSFDPDFQGDNYTNTGNPNIGLGLLSINNGTYALPTGAAGDEVFIWVISERRPDGGGGFIEPVLFDIWGFYDLVGGLYDPFTWILYGESDVTGSDPDEEGSVSIWLGHLTRRANLDEITVIYSEHAGPTAWVVGDFPPGTWEEDAWTNFITNGSSFGASESISPGGSVNAGFVLVNGPSGGVFIDPTAGADVLESNVDSATDTGRWEIEAWAAETTPTSVEISTTGDNIMGYAVFKISAAQARRWWLGTAGWG